MAENFDIRDNNWNPSYPFHSIHSDILLDITGFFNLKLSLSS